MLKLLIADDMKDIHLYLERCLSNHEVLIDHAFDGHETLQPIEAGVVYDLILLDWEMPGLNGPQVMERLNERGCRIPIIMLTSKNEPSMISAMLDLGVKEYLLKPVTPAILIERIELVLNRSLSHATRNS